MSNIEQLNSAVQAYRGSLSNDDFRNVLDIAEDQRTTNRRVMLKSGYGCEHSAQEVFDDTLCRLLRKDDVLDFARLLAVSLKNARNDFYRKEKRRLSRLYVAPTTDKQDEPDTPISETSDNESGREVGRKRREGNPADIELMTDGVTAEERAIERERKKKAADIVDHLLPSWRTEFGSTMTVIIEELPYYESPYALEKAKGLKRHSVSRKIPALRRFYDANRFGDIREVLIG